MLELVPHLLIFRNNKQNNVLLYMYTFNTVTNVLKCFKKT